MQNSDDLFIIDFLASIFGVFVEKFEIFNETQHRQYFHNLELIIYNHISDGNFCIVFKAKQSEPYIRLRVANRLLEIYADVHIPKKL